MRVADWLEKRTGYRRLVASLLNEPVAGGARWSYVFGSALLVLFAVQATTGIVLALYYSASAREAWGSVEFLNHSVTLGWFVRGLHHWGSSAMVILLVVHLLQVFAFGAYRSPRELGWWTGLAMLGVTLAFSLTGYLLPWDQKGYWATNIVADIVQTIPFVGRWLKGVMIGGNDFGNLTLTRFYGFHVFFLPGALTALALLHVFLFRRAGVTPFWTRTEADLEAKTEPFWPRQIAYDAVFAVVVLVATAGLSIARHGAPLEAPADPSSNYVARPEWYFLWLFQTLKLLPGSLEGVGITALTLAIALFLAVLPLVERAKTAAFRHRWVHFVVAGAIVAGVSLLTFWPMRQDARDPARIRQTAEQDRLAKRAYVLAGRGIPPGGVADLELNDPRAHGERLFAEQCSTCHRFGRHGSKDGCDLNRYMTRAWVRGVIEDPTRPNYYGQCKVEGMPPSDLDKDELEKLTSFVLSLGGRNPAPAGGDDLFEDKGCHDCHALAGEGPRTGPSFAGYGSRSWVLAFVKAPGEPANYGSINRMPNFQGVLPDPAISDIAEYLLSDDDSSSR